MHKTLVIIHRLAVCALALAGLVLMSGELLMGDWRPMGLWALCASLMALITAHIPGRRKARTRTIPMRLLVALPLAALLIAAFFAAPWLPAEMGALPRAACGLLMAALFLLQVRECSAQSPIFERTVGLCVGAGLYLAAGIAVWSMEWWGMNAALYGCAAAFLAFGAFSLNTGSLDAGYAAHHARKPAAGVLRANRLLLALLLIAIAFVSLFDRIRAWTHSAVLAVVRGAARFVLWFFSLLAPETVSGGGGGAETGLFPMEEAGEPSIFWQILYYALLAVALAVAAFLLYQAARKIIRGLKALIRRLAEYFHRFAETIGEEYTDERTSLFDTGELRRSMGDSVKKTIRRLSRREKRWERMDAREKVRHIVRLLYRKTGDSYDKLRPLTVREAAGQLDIGAADRDALADLYDLARYSEEPVTESEAEALKKAVKPERFSARGRSG